MIETKMSAIRPLFLLNKASGSMSGFMKEVLKKYNKLEGSFLHNMSRGLPTAVDQFGSIGMRFIVFIADNAIIANKSIRYFFPNQYLMNRHFMGMDDEVELRAVSDDCFKIISLNNGKK